MREIKFRAWDKEEKRFWSEEEMNKIGGYYYTFGVSDNDGEFVLQQYTGLKDKNGKEIYEGDYCKQFFAGKNEKGQIVIEPTRGTTVGGYPAWPHDIEIIGNIYENGDLIKDSTK